MSARMDTETTGPTPAPPATAAHPTERIGDRLRRVRRQQGLSLAEVEQRSDGVWKAVVVGAYERGDRSVSVTRLAGLADFYGIPLSELLPGARTPSGDRSASRVVLDLAVLSEPQTEPVAAVARFAAEIQHRRGDHNGRMLSLRADDVELLALTVGVSSRQLLAELRERSIVRLPPP